MIKKNISNVNVKEKTKTVTAVSKIDKTKFAVFSHLNNQFKVSLGEKIFLPYAKNIKKDEKVIFENVLMTEKNIGTPYLNKYAVVAKCLEVEIKDEKIIVFKYKSKKNYRVKTGHRQKYTWLQVIKIDNNYSKPKKITKNEL